MITKLNFKNLLFLVLLSLVIASCAEDAPDSVPEGPSISLDSNASIQLDLGASFTMTVTAEDGDLPLNALTIQEDGTNIEVSRILSVNGNTSTNNPYLITGDDKDGATFEIVIQSHAGLDTRTYTVVVIDEGQITSSVSMDVEVIGLGPSITQMTSGNIAAAPDSKLIVEFVGSKGTGQLATLAVLEEGNVMDPTRVFYNGIAMSVDNNPFLLPEADRDGFTSEIAIQTSPSTGPMTYEVRLADQYGLVATTEFIITTGTPIDDSLTGVLLNSAGPGGQGGLDLDTGDSVGSGDSEAEIKDEGIDSDLQPEDNWLQTISGANDSALKYLIAGQNGLSESFTFENVQFKEDLPSLINNGVDFTAMNMDGELVSNAVQVGDVFIVQREANYYLIKVTEVNVKVADNSDNYIFDVKK